MTPSTVYLLPVGFPMGVLHGEGAPVAVIRVGAGLAEVGLAEYEVWNLAAEHPAHDALVAAAYRAGVPDPAAVLGTLHGSGLLTVADPASAELPHVLSRLRLVALGIGLGNTPAEPETCLISGPDLEPRVSVSPGVYSVWATSYQADIWTACGWLATQPEPPETSPAGVLRLRLARAVVASLPVLLAGGVAYLDEAA
ncbi:hypothetical protein [Longispora albida]|uniref:hypothetical protein n=1 Tax=Longispora albida TaxID=203523 RepID=UPI00036AE06C|nr:hypothetical protein [Longispora albida]